MTHPASKPNIARARVCASSRVYFLFPFGETSKPKFRLRSRPGGATRRQEGGEHARPHILWCKRDRDAFDQPKSQSSRCGRSGLSNMSGRPMPVKPRREAWSSKRPDSAAEHKLHRRNCTQHAQEQGRSLAGRSASDRAQGAARPRHWRTHPPREEHREQGSALISTRNRRAPSSTPPVLHMGRQAPLSAHPLPHNKTAWRQGGSPHAAMAPFAMPLSECSADPTPRP